MDQQLFYDQIQIQNSQFVNAFDSLRQQLSQNQSAFKISADDDEISALRQEMEEREQIKKAIGIGVLVVMILLCVVIYGKLFKWF